MTIDVEIETDALPDVMQLVRNGMEQERRRPKFGGGAVRSSQRLARLNRVAEAIQRAQERLG